MHEHGMIRDALRVAEEAARNAGGRLSGISMRVGAASGITVDAARLHAEAIAEDWWGFTPDLDIDESEDPADPGAHGVSLLSVRVED